MRIKLNWLSLQQHGIICVFPNGMYTAKVLPILKSGYIASLHNYRLISITPYFRKIVDKILITALRTQTCVQKAIWFCGWMFTGLAVSSFADKVRKHSGKFVVGLFLGFTQVFSTPHYSTLLKKT